MSRSLRIALAQFDFSVGAIADNAARIGRMIAQARDEYAADVVLFPELALCGYPPEDLLLRAAFVDQCAQALQALAQDVSGIVALVGWPERNGDALYNSVAVLRDGSIQTSS